MEKQLENPKFEVGKWYKVDGMPFMKYLDTHHTINCNFGYGINLHGCWTTSEFGLDSAVPATDKEVEEALIKEAEKKTKGASEITIKSLFDGDIYTFKDYRFEFVNNVLQIWDSFGWIAFMENGKWVEIIKDDFY